MVEKRGKVALMGSGELTSTMVEVHKELMPPGKDSRRAFFLDTPAGFQPNADDISNKAIEYFRKSIQINLEIASFKSTDSISDFDLQRLLRRLDDANYLLVGPGSPTYMVRQLKQSPVVTSLARIVERGGSLAIASAAAITAGRKALPVYELYKVGMELFWEDGLNLLGNYGLDLVVIPHWNNSEGGTHDTRFCYMGEYRFDMLRKLLDYETLYLGIDEHTACVIDLEKCCCTVKGQGGVTLQQGRKELFIASGKSFEMDLLVDGIYSSSGFSKLKEAERTVPSAKREEGEYWKKVHTLEDRFHKGIARQNYRESINALISLDDHLFMSSQNFESEEDLSQTREIYRELIVILGVELEDAGSKWKSVSLLIEKLIKLRSGLKKQKLWTEADAVRDMLGEAGIIVEDTPAGPKWKCRQHEGN